MLGMKPRHGGFTLIELMVTLTIMAITMTVLLKAAAGQQDQARYNITVDRVEKIKRAILDVSSVNGVPMVSGFVADMGRLPRNIHELLSPRFCPSDFAGAAAGASCSSGVQVASTWGIQSVCSDGTTPTGTPPTCPNPLAFLVKLSAGWNGPYLQTTQNPEHLENADPLDHTTGESDAFTDGWGNKGEPSYPDQRYNYGWYFDFNNLSTTTNSLCNSTVGASDCVTLFSYGNGCFKYQEICRGNAAAPDLMDFSYPLSDSPISESMVYNSQGKSVSPNLTSQPPVLPPPLVKPEQWRVNIANTGATVVVAPNTCKTGINCTGGTTAICLNIYFIRHDSAATAILHVATSNPALIPENGTALSISFVFPTTPEPIIPVGHAAISIHSAVGGVCTTANSTANNIYPTGHPQAAVPVTILAGQVPVFTW